MPSRAPTENENALGLIYIEISLYKIVRTFLYKYIENKNGAFLWLAANLFSHGENLAPYELISNDGRVQQSASRTIDEISAISNG